MGKRKFSAKQRMSILAEHDAGASIADLCRKHQISPATLYNWKKEKATDEDEQLRRLKELSAWTKISLFFDRADFFIDQGATEPNSHSY